MESQFYYYIFFALGFLQLTWFLGYKKYTTKKQTLILTLLLSIDLVFNFFQVDANDFLLLVFFILQPIFVLNYLHSWILMTLFLFLNNSFLILSWLFTYDFLKLLFENHLISLHHFKQFTNLSIFLQQLLLFFFIQAFNHFDNKFSIFDSISRISKKYKFQSIIAIIFLIVLGIARRILVNGYFTESFFYITAILLILNITVHLTAYIYSQYYQQILKKNILSRQFSQEMDKIILSDEFRHDYRNILLSLNSYIENGEVKEALEFIQSIVNYSQPLLEDTPYEELSHIEILAIQGLLFKFIDLAKSNGVSLSLSIPKIIRETDISIQLSDLIQCLSISLEYAFENHKNVLLQLKKENKNIIVRLTNDSFKEIILNDLPMNIKEDPVNLKKEKIQIISKILAKYNTTSFEFLANDQHFLLAFSFLSTDSVSLIRKN